MSLNNGIVISHLQHSLVVINRATFCFSMWIYIYIYMYIYIYIYIYIAKLVIFRGTSCRRSSVFEHHPVREISPSSLSCLRRSSSITVSLTLLVALFLVKFPFLGVNYLNELNVKEFLGTML